MNDQRSGRLCGVLVACLLAVAGCDKATGPEAQPSQADPARLQGTVRFADVGSGCWIIDTPAGRIQPLNLPEAFRVDGVRVSFEAREATDVLTTCQAGELRYVYSVREVD